MSKQYAPLVDAIMEIKYETTLFHLRFEQYLEYLEHGDGPAITKRMAERHLDQSDWYANAMLHGGENEDGTFTPIAGTVLQGAMREVIASLNLLRHTANQREADVKEGLHISTAGKKLDVILQQVLLQSDKVKTALLQAMNNETLKFQRVLVLLGSVLALFLAVVMVMQYRHALKIRESENEFRKVIDTARDAFIQMDADGIITSWNPEAEKIFGWKSEQVIGRVLGDTIIPSEYRSAHAQGLKQFLASGKEGIIANKIVEITAMHFDEHIFPIELSVVPVHTGVTWTFNAFIRDTSVRKQAEAQVRKLSSLIEQSEEGVVVTDRDGTIEYVNSAFVRLTGYSPEEAIGQNPRILNSGNQDAAFYKNMWDTILSGKVWQDKVIDRKKDGSFYPVMLTISPIRNEAGKIAHFAATHADLTEHDEMQAKFEQAQKMEAIGTLVGGIAHNFNNMLAGISGNMYLLRLKMKKMPQLLDKVQRVEGLTRQAADMVSELLTFARKGIVEKKDVDLVVFLKEAYKLAAVALPENIKITQEFTSESLPIHGDANQIQQVMINLINNARDAVADVGAPEIRICLGRFEADSGFLKIHPRIDGRAFKPSQTFARLSISDNGCGIPEEQLPDIFEPFFTTKEVGMGTGLGLAMSYGATREHGGVMDVESEVGKGTIFSVYLPLTQSQVVRIDAHDEENIPHGSGETILLVDDEQHVRETGGEVLEALGYNILLAENGRQAIKKFEGQKDQVDLIILDVVMPEMGGPEAAKQIKEIDPDAKIIFSTGYDLESTLGQVSNISSDGMLSKPFAVSELQRVIRKQLDS